MPNPYLGEIRLFAGNFAPEGWAFCNGQLLNVQDYPALFGLLGSTYGGDGINNFALPDLQGRAPVHTGNGLPRGTYGGAETVPLYPSNLPAHTHAVNCASTGNNDNPKDAFWGTSAAKPYAAPPGTLAMHPAAVGVAGGGVPHENRIPFLAMSYIIALTGVQPETATNPYISEMRVFTWPNIPQGWMPCEGQRLAITANTALFTLLGNAYGGDSKTTFALPDLRGRVPMNSSATKPIGKMDGEATHVLTTAEIPQHNHLAMASADTPNDNTPAGNYWASFTGFLPYNIKSDTLMDGSALLSAGENAAHENMAPFVTVSICMAIQGIFPLGQGTSDQYLGEVRMFGGSAVPTGWARCDGSLLPIPANEALFSLLRTVYGGNGASQFALPDLTGRASIGMGSGAGLSIYALGESGGVETWTLSIYEMATHSHVAMANQIGTLGPPEGTVWADPGSTRQPPNFFANNPARTVAMNKGAFSPMGGSQPHNNLMPYTTVAFYIALQGEFPHRG